MRIVAVADTHLCHRGLRVPDGDVLVHAGDLLRRGTLEELGVAAAWLRALPHRTKIVVAGNHDWAFAREPAVAREMLGEDVIYLEDAGATVRGLSVWGSPWQPEFFGWAFNKPRGPELAAIWERIPEGLDLLITHGPPFGYGDRVSRDNRQGCEDLRDRVAVVRPRVHLFGHIHEDGGTWTEHGTLFANVTTDEGDRDPTVIEIDAAEVHVIESAPGRFSR